MELYKIIKYLEMTEKCFVIMTKTRLIVLKSEIVSILLNYYGQYMFYKS